MQSIFAVASIALLAAAGVSAAPTKTYCDAPTPVKPAGHTHTIVVGRPGLKFEPDNTQAEIGDVIEWHFFPRNHSIVQSSFGEPCQPLAGGFSSGFNFATKEGQAPDVFTITIKDKKPIWYYCSQTTGNHCQNGMTGVINQNYDNQDFSLAKHRELAAKAPQSVTPAKVSGGEVKANPKPLAGA